MKLSVWFRDAFGCQLALLSHQKGFSPFNPLSPKPCSCCGLHVKNNDEMRDMEKRDCREEDIKATLQGFRVLLEGSVEELHESYSYSASIFWVLNPIRFTPKPHHTYHTRPPNTPLF